MIILKIGGSALSNKRSGKSFTNMVANIVSEEIPKGEKIVIVQGAGYVGHGIASKYKIYKLDGNQREWAMLRHRVEGISNAILKVMIDYGHAPIMLSAPLLFRVINGRTHLRSIDYIKAYLHNGFIPFIHSDAPLDNRNGMSILSGDDMAVMLANALKAKMLIFGTDVDGVYGPGNKIIKSIRKKDIDILNIARQREGVDVTGGLKAKLEKAAHAGKGTKVLIINLRKRGELAKAVKGLDAGTVMY